MQEIYMAAKHGSYGILKDSILPENVKALQGAGYKVTKPAYDGMKFSIEWR